MFYRAKSAVKFANV